jgi:hypothetical protein
VPTPALPRKDGFASYSEMGGSGPEDRIRSIKVPIILRSHAAHVVYEPED